MVTYPNMIPTEKLRDKFQALHSVPYTDRNSLTELECLSTYFPQIPVRPKYINQDLEHKEAKRRIRQALKLCESDPDCFVGRFWRPYEWRICSPDEKDLKWMIVKKCWTMLRAWQKKEGHYKKDFGFTITEADLIIFEKEVESKNDAKNQAKVV